MNKVQVPYSCRMSPHYQTCPHIIRAEGRALAPLCPLRTQHGKLGMCAVGRLGVEEKSKILNILTERRICLPWMGPHPASYSLIYPSSRWQMVGISSPPRVNPTLFPPTKMWSCLQTPGSQQVNYFRTLFRINQHLYLLKKSKHIATTNAFEPILMQFIQPSKANNEMNMDTTCQMVPVQNKTFLTVKLLQITCHKCILALIGLSS